MKHDLLWTQRFYALLCLILVTESLEIFIILRRVLALFLVVPTTCIEFECDALSEQKRIRAKRVLRFGMATAMALCGVSLVGCAIALDIVYHYL